MVVEEKKILLLEDEKNLAFSLKLNLCSEGFTVLHAESGLEALQLFREHPSFAAVILDVMVPEPDGYEVAAEVRRRDKKVGILFLTARAGECERLRGFEVGADDYLTKPFQLQELLLRVKRMVERASFYAQEEEAAPSDERLLFKLGPLQLNANNLSLKTPRGIFHLTALETDILKEFMRHPRETLSRKYLLSKVWGMPGDIATRTVDNFVLRIRKYIERDPGNPEHLLSVRGRGYCLNLEPEMVEGEKAHESEV